MAVRWVWKRKPAPFPFSVTWPAPVPAGGPSMIRESEVDVLARYNAERARGILHTFEWQEQMAELQRRFDEVREPRRL